MKIRNRIGTLLCVGLLFAPTVGAWDKEPIPVCVVSSYDRRIEKDVWVDGVPVGGLTLKNGLEKIRKQATPEELTVETPTGKYVFTDELAFTDDCDAILSRAKRGGRYLSKRTYYLKGLEEKTKRIVADNSVEGKDACVLYDKSGFTYYKSVDGRLADKEKLERDILSSLLRPILTDTGVRFEPVKLSVQTKKSKFTESDARKRTKEIGSFTTYYNAEDESRSENIRLAGELLDGYTLLPKQVFSFNAVVGERSEKRGFKQAKIIQDGEFVLGNGGGVCQVSTTLYNASLLSGLTVAERSAHSLAVAYVSPSRDAMVSSCSDLKIKNPYEYPVYLSVKTGKGFITVRFYGKETGLVYKIVSEVEEEITPPEPEIRFGQEEKQVRAEKKGLISVAYLEKYVGGCLVERKKLTRDQYKCVRGIIESPAKKE